MKLKPAFLKSLLFLGFMYGFSVVQAEVATELQIKARYVFNFAKLVKWPDAPQGSMMICVMGDNLFQTQLEQFSKEQAAEFQHINKSTEIDQCRILVLTAENANQLNQWIIQVDSKPILTISDSTGSLRAGVMIELVTHSDRIAFKINRKKISDSSLYLSAGLLKLAEEVL